MVVIVKGSTIESERGKRFLMLMTSVRRMLSDEGVKKTKLILPLVNNAQNFASIKQLERNVDMTLDFVRLKNEALRDLDLQEQLASDILNNYDGPQFPSESELDSMQDLLSNFKQSYYCIDPDNEFGKLAKRSIEIADLKPLMLRQLEECSIEGYEGCFATDLD